MALIKSERYTKELKAYLTYPPDIRILPYLFDEEIEERFVLTLPNRSRIKLGRMSEKLSNELISVKANIEKARTLIRKSKESIFGVPVQIRQIKRRDKKTKGFELESVRVRITGKNLDELHRDIDKIVAGLKVYGVKYTECIWISDIPEPTKKETKPQKISPLEKKLQKVTNIVEDLRDKVEDLEKPAIRKRIKEEDNVREGVIR